MGKDRVRKFGVAKAATANPEAAKQIKAGKVVAKKRSNAVVSKELPSKLEVPPGESEKEKAVETSSSPTAEMNNNTAFLPEAAAAMAPEYIPPLNRKPAFPNLTKMNANGTDRVSGYRREEIMTELLQWDKKNSVNVSLCKRENRELSFLLTTVHMLTSYAQICFLFTDHSQIGPPGATSTALHPPKTEGQGQQTRARQSMLPPL